MNLAAALIFAVASAIGFAVVSDHLVRAARDFFAWDFGFDIHWLLDTGEIFGSAVTGVLGGVVGYLLTRRYSRTTTGERGFYRPAFLCATFVISLALSMFLSLIAALWGAGAAGVGAGGYGWQFIGALYGGPFVGLVTHLFIFFRTWTARHDIRVSFVFSSLLPPLAAFILSLAGHFLWVSQRTITATNHSLQRTAPCVTAPASTAAFPPHHAGAAAHSAVAELGVVRQKMHPTKAKVNLAIDACRKLLTEEEFREVFDHNDHSEWGLAIESLADIIVEKEIPINSAQLKHIEKSFALMKLNLEGRIEYLRELMTEIKK